MNRFEAALTAKGFIPDGMIPEKLGARPYVLPVFYPQAERAPLKPKPCTPEVVKVDGVYIGVAPGFTELFVMDGRQAKAYEVTIGPNGEFTQESLDRYKRSIGHTPTINQK